MLEQMTARLDFHGNALMLRSQRQQVLASNIANADTTEGVAITDARHLSLQGAPGTPKADLAYTVQTQPSQDRNTVDLDRERANFVDNSIRYESTLRFINGHVKTMLSAITGQ